MNLLFVTAGFPFGKSEPYIENEINLLAERFERVYILAVTSDTSKRRAIEHGNVYVFNFSPKRSLYFLLRAVFSIYFWKEIISGDFSIHKCKTALTFISCTYQIVEFIQNTVLKDDVSEGNLIGYSYWLNEGAGALGLLKCQGVIKTAVSRAHGWDVYFERHPFNYLPLRKWLHARLDIIYTVSQNGKNYLEQKLNKTDGIEVSRLGTMANENVEHSFPVNDDILRIVSCSAMIKLKRVDLIYKILQSVDSISIEWVHYGAGPLYDAINELIRMNRNEKLKINLMGHLDNEQFLAELRNRSFSLLINVSETEGIPVSMMEAMSSGILCIGTDVGGVHEIIINGYNGWLVPSNSAVAEGKRAVEKYISMSHEQKRQMSDNARTTWNKLYNAQTNYEDFINRICALN